MKQYCRYCAFALDYNGEKTDFICNSDAPCGNNGAGKFYPANKAKRPNRCKQFEFNENDIFGQLPDGNFRVYHPREPCRPRSKGTAGSEQMKLEDA